jgi:dihydroorotase
LPVPNRYGAADFGEICPEFFDAVKRGVLLDVGHGKTSFSWKLAEMAFKEGLKPNTISTDLWVGNLHGPVFDMPTTMAKFLHLGMTLEEVVTASTVSPALAIDRSGEIGTLKPGACADIAVFKLQEGRFPLVDCYGESRVVSRMFTPTRVVRNGDIMF